MTQGRRLFARTVLQLIGGGTLTAAIVAVFGEFIPVEVMALLNTAIIVFAQNYAEDHGIPFPSPIKRPDQVD